MIELINTSNPQHKYHFNSKTITIGRAPYNDIVINDFRVSKFHARIDRQDKGYYLKDLNSTNGTFFNGRKIEFVHLYSQDTFKIANQEFKFLEISENINYKKDFEPKQLYSSNHQSNIFEQKNSTRNVNYIPWSIGALIFIIMFILIYLYYPFYEVETGNIVTCKHCGKEITNTVHTVRASLLDKDDYKISYGKDYCQKCGSELVPYKINIKCSNCNKVYATRIETAPRRLEQHDKYITEGYCSNSCKILGETKDLLNEGQEVIEGLFDNFIF